MDLFVLADADEQVFEFLNIVDLATRFYIRFPVPPKRPDDVLSVLETVRINWAGPMSHLTSDMGGAFEGELGEFAMAFDNISWHLMLRAKKSIKDVGARGFVEYANTCLHGELGKERPHQLVWILARPVGLRSRIHVALVTSGREAKRRTGIAGVARSLA